MSDITKDKGWEDLLGSMTDEQMTRSVLGVIGWETYEYPDSIPDQDRNGNMLETEISLYGMKTNTGRIYNKGFAFEDDVYKNINIFSFAFIPNILQYLNSQNLGFKFEKNESSVGVWITGNDEYVYYAQSEEDNAETPAYYHIPRLLAKSLLAITYIKKS